jgi:hypothetical protein
MMRLRGISERMAEERGTITLTALFFLLCLGGLVSLLLLLGQAGLLSMQAQQTADIVSKGARAAGKWEYTDDQGSKRTYLFATTREARRHNADIVRGAREEADILWRLNSPAVERRADEAVIIHQKGEQKYLYRQGIYHVRVQVFSRLPLLWQEVEAGLDRTSQSGIYDF